MTLRRIMNNEQFANMRATTYKPDNLGRVLAVTLPLTGWACSLLENSTYV